ncbi:MAG: DUF4396 domain-containing protein [Rhizobiales bacterium]|nr:DUF4396 domain-containing protein [Hyphomicrobiales bacterium]
MAHSPAHHAHHPHHGPENPAQGKLRRLAFQATLHCMTGCAIGEIAGLVIGTALGLGMWQTVALAVTLAFLTGFAMTMVPLLRSGMAFGTALGIAFAADFVSVSIMEIVDNAVMMLVPGAMSAGLASPLFWGTMVAALAIAFVAAYPVNLWLIARGKGHAVVHAHHHH